MLADNSPQSQPPISQGSSQAVSMPLPRLLTQHQPDQSQQSCGFLNLPAEIRYQIYRLALPTCLALQSKRLSDRQQGPCDEVNDGSYVDQPPALLQVCRIIRADTIGLFYRTTHFMPLSSEGGLSATNVLKRFFKGVPPGMLAFLASLTYPYRLSRPKSPLVLFVVHNCVGLKALTIEVDCDIMWFEERWEPLHMFAKLSLDRCRVRVRRQGRRSEKLLELCRIVREVRQIILGLRWDPAEEQHNDGYGYNHGPQEEPDHALVWRLGQSLRIRRPSEEDNSG